MEFSILGPLEVRAGAGPVALAGAKPRALLATLALHVGETVSIDRLIDVLWGEEPPATAPNVLQAYVSQLRKALGADAVLRRPPGYALAVEPDAVDLVRFERLVEDARSGDAVHAAERLREALSLWRGDPEVDAPRLEELRLTALEERIEADLALGRHAELVAELERLVDEHPLRERPRGQLMLALYRSGRQAEALDLFRSTRELLVEQLGLEPSPTLQRLERAILAQDAELEAPARPGRGSLPAPPTPIVGRAAEIEQAAALLRDGTRLLTFTGPGGIGKTRLALEVAHTLEAEYRDGVWFVGLTPLSDPALVAPTLLQALGAPADADLVDEVRTRELLLVLDNFEQLVEAAPLLSGLLAAAPGLSLLVTSRTLLRLAGERELPVPPLEDAAELFVQRARAVAPDLDPEAHAEAIREICARLEGLPLAIELAAARVRLLPPPALLARLTSRLELLTAGSRDAPERQRTMRATVDWSYRLLEPDEQILFARLGVFVGGASLEAIEAVCGEVATLDALASLVDNSLLRQRGAVEPRFVMLETLREYGLEQLAAMGEAEALRHRHTQVFLELARAGEAELEGPGQAAWMARLEADHANLRAAVAAAVATQDGDTAVGLAAALRRFWQVHGHVEEGLRVLESVADAFPDAPPLDRNKVLNGAGILLGERGDYAASRARFEQALAVARGLGDPLRTGAALVNLGNFSLYDGDYDGAYALYQEARELSEAGGDSRAAAIALENLGLVELGRGDVSQAIETFERSIERAEAGQGLREAASVSIPLARTLIGDGDVDRARALLRDALATFRELGDPHKTSECLEAVAALAAALGEPEDAAALLGAGAGLRESIGAVRHGDQRRWYEATVERVRAALGDERYDAASGRGREERTDECAALCTKLW